MKHTPEEIKNRLSNIGEAIGKIALDYIVELEKENAGLKAGRPQWHDLRKDKNDLPDEGTYLVVWQNNKGYKEIFIMNYEEDDEEELHWVDGDCEVQDEHIIAWCELPTFDKE